ncbi:B-block binding subunit of TFIIIC family protein [Pseudohyphozyma bogoriensis]|nr:B-block binding subunit of TFIIIC family protein [Pseudohyphozyma bogoriensis]
MGGIDSLIQFVLEEIAMDGEQGTDVSSLASFVELYYSQPSTSHQVQVLDEQFISFVWDTLVQLEEVRVAVLSANEDDAAEDKDDAEKDEEMEMEDEDDDEDGPKKKNKGKGKAKAKVAQAPTFELNEVSDEERYLGRDVLVDKYGDKLRIAVSPEETWAAITGSHARPTNVTVAVYALLQLVSRGRNDGATVVEIARELEFDPRSCFHFVKVASDIGAVKKFRTHVAGSWTNRVLHVRYLSTSPHWAMHIARDRSPSPTPKDEDDSEVEGLSFPTISATYIDTNRNLVRNRIIRVIREAGGEMPHIDIAGAIGFLSRAKRDLRKLNGVITQMYDEKILQRMESNRVQWIDKPRDEEVLAVSVEYDGDISRASALLSIERQIVDLLLEADAEGMRNFDISDALGGFSPRFIDQILTKISKADYPVAASDQKIVSFIETLGREKRTRWFSATGYLRRCERDGVPFDVPPESEEVGGWTNLVEDVYEDSKDLVRKQKKTDLGRVYQYGKKQGRGPAKPKAPADPNDPPKKRGRPPKKVALLRKEAEGEQGGDMASDVMSVVSEGSVEVESPAPKKKLGRPRKHPEVDPAKPKGPVGRPRKKPKEDDGKLSYYERKKRQFEAEGKLSWYARKKLEDEERAKQGLPPRKGRVKRDSSVAKTPIPENNDEVDQLASPGPQDTPATESAAPAAEVTPNRPPVASTSASTLDEQQPVAEQTFEPTPARGKRPRASSGSTSAPTPAPKRGKQVAFADPTAVASSSTSTPAPAPTSKKSVSKASPHFFVGPFPLSPRRSASKTPAVSSTPTAESGTPRPPSSTTPALQPRVSSVGSPFAAAVGPSKRKLAARSSLDSSKALAGKFNLTALQRQNEVLGFVKDAGGICDRRLISPERVRVYMDAQNSGPQTTMDRKTCKQAIDGLLERGICASTSIQAGEGAARGRFDLLYLFEIALDSPEMVTFIQKLNESLAPRPAAKRKLEYQGDEDVAAMGEAPSPTASTEVVRDYYRRHPLVAAASNGCLHGKFARARELHQFLARFHEAATSADSAFLLEDGQPTRIFYASSLTPSLPLEVYLRIVPVSNCSNEFKTFLADEKNLQIPVGKLPRGIRDIVAPNNSKRKKAIITLMQLLISLGLVTPLIPLPDAPKLENGLPQLVVSRKPKFAPYWQLNESAPIHAVRVPGVPLLTVLSIKTSLDVENWWKTLYRTAVLGQSVPSEAIVVEGFDPASYPTPSKTTVLYAQSQTKWKDDYMLLMPQRKYLLGVLRKSSDFNLDEQADVVAKLADDILAPPSSVETYFRNRQAAETQDEGDQSGSGGAQEGDGEAPAPEGRSAKDMTAALKTKAAAAAEQREHDWQALIERFSKAHGDVTLTGPIVDFLHTRFTMIRAASRLDARSLEQELFLLLPPDQGTRDPNYKSIVPASIQHAAAVANDPYALPRRPKIRRRPRAVPKLATAPPRERAPNVETSGTQHEFLTTAPRAVPQLAKGERLPRDFFNEEQDDLCIDAVAIIYARREHLDARMTFAALGLLFEGIPTTKLRTHYLRTIERRDLKVYAQRLQEAWTRVWEAKRGDPELPDPQPTSMTEFDIAAHVRCLRANVDKKLLHFLGAPEQVQGPSVRLPSSLKELTNNYNVSRVFGTDERSAQWGGYWKSGGTLASRESEASDLPFSSPCWDEEPPSVVRETSLATSALKMVLATPEAHYNEDDGHAFISPFEKALAGGIVTNLTDTGVITKTLRDASRRAPGRNYVISDKYLATFEESLPRRKGRDASRLEDSLWADDAVDVWPLLAEDGDMMALVDLVSDGKVELTIDTSPSADLRDPDDYQTRKADDESIENAVHIKTVGRPSSSPANPVSKPAADEIDDDEKPLIELADIVDDEEGQLLQLVRDAGASGLTMSSIESLQPLIAPAKARTSISTIINTKPPLAFLAGDTAPALIASRWLSSWAVMSAKSTDGKCSPFFPYLWLDIRGQMVPDLWNRASWWLKSFLAIHPGSTCVQIFARAQAVGTLNLLEVMQLLTGLRERRDIEPRSLSDISTCVQTEQAGESVDWVEDRWFLREGWFRV